MSARERPEKPDKSGDDIERLLLSNKQELAIEHVLSGKTWGEVASLLDVDPKTVYRWRKNPMFMAQVKRIQRERRTAASARVESEITKSITTLVELRDNVKVAHSVRRQCAWDILEIAGVVGKRAEPIAPAGDETPEVDRAAIADFLADALTRAPEPETTP
jgi:transposase-like protein